MNVNLSPNTAWDVAQTGVSGNTPSLPQPPSATTTAAAGSESELRQAFDSFVGQTFFGQMLQAMRKTVGKPAYFYGGRAEEIFQQQLDQVLGEKLSKASADKISGPMFELFSLGRP